MQKKGILHRDIKPSNLGIKDGTLKIFDFGTSEIVSQCTNNLNLVGTQKFMSPELLKLFNEDVDFFPFQVHENLTIRTSLRIKCSTVFKSDVFSEFV